MKHTAHFENAPERAERYRTRARAIRTMVKNIGKPEIREQLEEIAIEWDELAAAFANGR